MGLGLLYILKINPCPVKLSDFFLKKKTYCLCYYISCRNFLKPCSWELFSGLTSSWKSLLFSQLTEDKSIISRDTYWLQVLLISKRLKKSKWIILGNNECECIHHIQCELWPESTVPSDLESSGSWNPGGNGCIRNSCKLSQSENRGLTPAIFPLDPIFKQTVVVIIRITSASFSEFKMIH